MSRSRPQNEEDESHEATPATLDLRARAVPANDTATVRPVAGAGPFGLPRAYWTLWCGMLLNRLGGAVFFLLGLYLTRERGLSPELAGFVISLYAAGGLLAGPVGGALADRFGRRATLLSGTAASGAFMLALGGARSTETIVALAPLLGFFTDLCRPPLQAAVADLVPPADRARAYGLLYWAMNLGFAVASALGGALAVHHFGALFVIDALSTFAYAAIVFLGVRETRPAVTRDRSPGGDEGGACDGEQGADGRRPTLLAPFRDRPFVTFTLIQVVLLVAFAQVIVILPLDMGAHGLDLKQIGLLLGLNGVYIVGLQPLALRYGRRLGHLRWLVSGALLTGLGLGATALARGPLGYALTAVLWTLGEVGFSTASPAIVAAFSPVAQRGAYQGVYQLSWGTAIMAAPVLGSLVLARAGSTALWGGCLVACFTAAALHLRITGRRLR
ncbi:MAG TPA: MFS transporter [Polyangia bacterium]